MTRTEKKTSDADFDEHVKKVFPVNIVETDEDMSRGVCCMAMREAWTEFRWRDLELRGCGFAVTCHALILVAHSPRLLEWLQDALPSTVESGVAFSVTLPDDISSRCVMSLLELVYLGQVFVTSSQLQDMQYLAEVLGLEDVQIVLKNASRSLNEALPKSDAWPQSSSTTFSTKLPTVSWKRPELDDLRVDDVKLKPQKRRKRLRLAKTETLERDGYYCVYNEERANVDLQGKIRCGTCDKGFSNRIRYAAHQIAKHDGLPACPMCGVTEYPNGFSEHVRLKHQKILYVCKTCGIRKKRTNEIRDHITLKHPELSTAKDCLMCNICGKSAPTRKLLTDHMRRIHRAPNLCVCPVCGKTVKVTSLNMHRKSHQEASHECRLCGKMFQTTSSLNKHAELHWEKSWKCLHCAKAFSRSDYLKVHLSKVHDETWSMKELKRFQNGGGDSLKKNLTLASQSELPSMALGDPLTIISDDTVREPSLHMLQPVLVIDADELSSY